MGGVDWVWSHKGSSFFKEVVEFAVFSSGVVVLSGLVGDSRDSDVDFGELFEGESFPGAESFFFGLGLFPKVRVISTLIRRRRR